MPLTTVNPNSTDIAHLASVDVEFSGTHIGGGIYLATNHDPNTDGRVRTAIPQRSLNGEAEPHSATEIDYVVDNGANPNDYLDDTNNDGIGDTIHTGFDTSLFAGDRLTSTGEFYDGPAISMLIANDPNNLTGNVTILGYPTRANSNTGAAGVLHETTGTLSQGGYTEETVGADVGGFFAITGAEAVGGMSGGGTFLDFDADGDGTTETYLVGTTSRAGRLSDGTPFTLSTSLSPHYSDLAAAIEGLSGTDARTADDFARMTLMSAQSLGSPLTTVQGEFFHEDIYGGVNADTLSGAGGNDQLFGGAGDDAIDGGTGSDRIDGGDGNDILTGGAGADWFAGSGFGGGAADVITDFQVADGDVIDLSAYFATLDDVVAATTDLGDGSISISLGGGSSVQVLNTSIGDLQAANLNVLCFTAGTSILTADGKKTVETLTIGAQIVTQSGEAKPLISLNIRNLGPDELFSRPKLWPIVIDPGALGTNIPSEQLCVSPQHRILVNSKIAQRMAGEPVLVPAKSLLPLPGISQPEPTKGVTYVHLVFEQHEVVQANGCWSESFFPGDQAMQALPNPTEKEYQAIFGDRLNPFSPIVDGKKATKLVFRHQKNTKPIQVAQSLGAAL
jgi:Ca2+-binding RTX toxin-like protein